MTAHDPHRYVPDLARATATGGPRHSGRSWMKLAMCLPMLITRLLIEDSCRGPAPGTPTGGASGRLSARELGVVRLVAQGLSNAEIAARLYLS